MKEIRPIVIVCKKGGHKIREGHGFSLDEIKQAGLDLHKAKLEVPIDKRRKTVYSENVKTLISHLSSSIPLTEIKGIGKVIEKNLKKGNISDIHDLAFANIKTLTDKVSYSEKKLKTWQSEAKRLLRNR